MTDDITSPAASRPAAALPPRGAWLRANTIGLGLAFAAFALVGGGAEAVGAGHDSLARNLPAIVAMLAGGVAFAWWRARALGGALRGPRWHPPVIGACLAAGFLLGVVAPFDWVVAMLLAGVVGHAVQLREIRPVSVASLLGSAGSWLAAGIAATAVVVVTIDGILVGLFGLDMAVIDAEPGGLSVAVFTLAFALLGVTGGAVGSAIEGALLRRYARRHN
jgi:hypothetical protein